MGASPMGDVMIVEDQNGQDEFIASVAMGHWEWR